MHTWILRAWKDPIQFPQNFPAVIGSFHCSKGKQWRPRDRPLLRGRGKKMKRLPTFSEFTWLEEMAGSRRGGQTTQNQSLNSFKVQVFFRRPPVVVETPAHLWITLRRCLSVSSLHLLLFLFLLASSSSSSSVLTQNPVLCRFPQESLNSPQVAAFTHLCVRGFYLLQQDWSCGGLVNEHICTPHGSAAVGQEQTKVREIWLGDKMRPGRVRSARKEEKNVDERRWGQGRAFETSGFSAW